MTVNISSSVTSTQCLLDDGFYIFVFHVDKKDS